MNHTYIVAPMETQNENGRIRLEPQWKKALSEEFAKPYMMDLREFLSRQIDAKKVIYPRGNEIFAAFDLTPLDKVRVVILGQDPYHGPGQAHGLCFSVRPGVALPPSLQNIFREQEQDLGIQQPDHGFLRSWADQGVLLLNSVLTVEKHRAASHQGRGWEKFTDQVIQVLNGGDRPIIFVLWGSYAIKKGAIIDGGRHKIFKSPHPSPLSAHRGFFGSKHFSSINETLRSWGQEPIQWQLPPKEEVVTSPS